MGMANCSRPSNTVGHMPIRSYLEDRAAFEPEAITAMSQAFEQACTALAITARQERERTVIATRIIDLARTGVIDAKALRDRVLLEAGSAT
jgi:hypothetical protein